MTVTVNLMPWLPHSLVRYTTKFPNRTVRRAVNIKFYRYCAVISVRTDTY